MRLKIRCWLFVVSALFAPLTFGAPPATINYQGYLTSSGGAPVNSAVQMTFRLYNAASGGAVVYSEVQPSVSVTNGSFSAVIGSVSPVSLPFDVPYWLTVAINGDAEMSPRQPLASSPYAFLASALDSTATINGTQVSGALTVASLPATQLTGTIASGQLAATQRLPAVACAAGEVPQWNGSQWNCATAGTGPEGPQGPAGPSGPAGPQGPQGPAGPSDVTGNLTMLNSTAASGNVFKAGRRFLHNIGTANTFTGIDAGNLTITGFGNTGNGEGALTANTSGAQNTAIGGFVLEKNTTGNNNVGIGTLALSNNVGGGFNTGIGNFSLLNLSSGDSNIAVGSQAGRNLVTGSNNIAIGHQGVSTESATIRLGTAQTRTFIAGISGVTPGLANPLPVVIDSNGQLGTGAAASGGGISSIDTGPGLTGGPVTSTGTIGLASTQLLPTVSCLTNQVVKWNGSAWACAADSNSGGTVTSIATGTGLTGGGFTTSGVIGLASTQLLPTVGCGLNQVAKWNGSAWACAADSNSGGTVTSITAGGGLGVLVGAAITPGGTITGTGTIVLNPQSDELKSNYFKQGGNAFGATAVLGVSDSQTLGLMVNGQLAVRYEPTAGTPNVIAGATQNRAIGAVGATIAGGGENTIGVPARNEVTASYGTVGGGWKNWVQATYGTVGGGGGNEALGNYSTVPGGLGNIAQGANSFAAGSGALSMFANNAASDGTFIWADAQYPILFRSVVANEFAARSTGGFRFVTAIDGAGNPTRTTAINPNGELDFGSATRQMLKLWGGEAFGIGIQSDTLYHRSNGHYAWYVGGTHNNGALAPGASGIALMTLTNGSLASPPAVTGIARAQAFTATSDRAAKESFETIDSNELLDALAKMPVQSWKYRNEDQTVRHIGPTAQDFRAAFGVGYDDKTIATVDADGVALAAIQGLHKMVKEKDEKIRKLEAALEEIRARLGMK